MTSSTSVPFDFIQWCADNGLGEGIASKLKEQNCTDMQTLTYLTEEDVQEITPKIGPRRKLNVALAKLRGEWKTSVYNDGEAESEIQDDSMQATFDKEVEKTLDFRSTFPKSNSVKRTSEILEVCVLQPSLIVGKKENTEKEQEKKIRKFELGKPDASKPAKVLVVVGQTGSGKTTLINGMVNYIFGVGWEDKLRYKLISEDQEAQQGNQAKSQTTWISAYTLHHQEGFQVPYSVTVVDTPGFGDTEGIKRDEFITQQIKEFFSSKGNLDHIDAVCFVINSSLARLSPTQKYIFRQIFQIFGKDIEENIFLMLTFADGKNPPVLSSIREAGINHEHFKFNNSAIYSVPEKNEQDDEIDEECDEINFDAIFWKMGMSNFEKFFERLQTVPAKSLTLTREVLDEREQLTLFVDQIKIKIRTALNKLAQLRKESQMVAQLDSEMLQTKDYSYTVEEQHVDVVDLPKGICITNCNHCNRTCHRRCAIKSDERKFKCSAMDSKGNCVICTENCSWKKHVNSPYEYVFSTVQVRKTVDELYRRYEIACTGKKNREELVKGLEDEFSAVQYQVIGMADKVRRSLKRLEEIALQPNTMSIIDYIKFMIENEKAEGESGFLDRVALLEGIKSHLEILIETCKGNFERFTDLVAQNFEKLQKSKKTKKTYESWATAEKWISELVSGSKSNN